jgi:hypothetical protein
MMPFYSTDAGFAEYANCATSTVPPSVQNFVPGLHGVKQLLADEGMAWGCRKAYL